MSLIKPLDSLKGRFRKAASECGTLLVCLVLLIFCSSCKKKVIATIPVFDYTDISLPDTGTVRLAVFPDPNTGYACTNFLYKTGDGGKSWQKLNFAGNPRSLVFFNANEGLLTSNTQLYRTADGGQTWQVVIEADFVDVSEGIAVIAKLNWNHVVVKYSEDKGKTFLEMPQHVNIDQVHRFKMCGNLATFIHGFDRDVRLLDLNDARQYTVLSDNTAAEAITDVFIGSTQAAMVGGDGFAGNLDSGNREYYGHTYPFYSIDGSAGFFVAVGFQTIITTKDVGNEEKWSDVFDKDLNGWKRTFRQIKGMGGNEFLVMGDRGLLWRGEI